MDSWTLVLDAPALQQLAGGSYQNARGARFSDFSHGQIALSGDGRQCFVDWGNFTVLDLAYDASQNLTRFAADVEVHCDEYEPAIFLGVRFNSSVPYVQPAIGFAGPAFIQWASQAGDRVKNGTSGTLTRADGVFNTRTEWLPSLGNGHAAGIHLWAYEDGSPVNFEIEMSAASGTLVPGTYENASGLPSGTPGLQVAGSEPCGGNGRFTIYEISFDPVGHVSTLAADFEEHCQLSTGGIFGGVRFNSTLPYTPPANVNSLPASLDLLDDSSYQVAEGAMMKGPRMQVLDGNQHGLPGVVVHFAVQAQACGTLNGALTADVVADSSGIAQMPAFVAGNSNTSCEVLASIPGTGVWQFPIFYYVYAPGDLTLTALPSSVMVVHAGDPFKVGVQAMNHGSPVAHTTATYSVVHETGGAAPTSLGTSAVSDVTGQAFVNGIAGPVEGTYKIVATISGATQSIEVVQHAAPAPPLSVNDLQDMWWAGTGENGWGMSLIDHGGTLFAALYIYDAGGIPTWLVMPGGSWDATNTIYTGALYTPTATPFYSYDGTREVVGIALGSITLTFQDANNAVLDYVIKGVAGRKLITREIYSSGSRTKPDHSDLWWGGASQNGWGITILQQADTLFPVWFTYDANGFATWYVMPGGTWTASDTYAGTVYRTTGSPWVGGIYDASKLGVIDAGTYSIQFTGDNASFSYNVDGHSGTIPLVKEPF